MSAVELREQIAATEQQIRDQQYAAGLVITDLVKGNAPLVTWRIDAFDDDNDAFPTLDGQAESLSVVEAYAIRWGVPVLDRFAGHAEFAGRSFTATAVLRGIHVRVWVRLTEEEAEHRRAIAEEAQREREEAAADWAQDAPECWDATH